MQKGIVARVVPAVFVLSAAALLSDAFAADASSFVSPRVNGYEEVPMRSSPALGRFTANVNDDGASIDYELSYSGFVTPVREAHIHFAKRRVNGGVMVFLCSNLPSAPPDTPACPEFDGTVTGTLVPASVVGPVDQGIAPGEFDEVLAAIRARAGYVNIHTEQYPAGEIRNQVLSGGNDDDDGGDD